VTPPQSLAQAADSLAGIALPLRFALRRCFVVVLALEDLRTPSR
jgi:hypothetical protein